MTWDLPITNDTLVTSAYEAVLRSQPLLRFRNHRRKTVKTEEGFRGVQGGGAPLVKLNLITLPLTLFQLHSNFPNLTCAPSHLMFGHLCYFLFWGTPRWVNFVKFSMAHGCPTRKKLFIKTLKSPENNSKKKYSLQWQSKLLSPFES